VNAKIVRLTVTLSAFQQNSLHGVNGPFPLHFDVRRHASGLCSTNAQAQRLADLDALLQPVLWDRFCIFDVGHYISDPNSAAGVSIADLISEEGLQLDQIDRNTVVVSASEFWIFLRNFSHYNMRLLGVPHAWAPANIEDAVLLANEHASRGGFLLEAIPGAPLYVSSHDDCYVYTELISTLTFPEMQLSALLQKYAEALTEQSVPSPSQDLCAQLLERSPTLFSIGRLCTVRGGDIKLGLSFDAEARDRPNLILADIDLVFSGTERGWDIQPGRDLHPCS
jgi:hypothetical protein